MITYLFVKLMRFIGKLTKMFLIFAMKIALAPIYLLVNACKKR